MADYNPYDWISISDIPSATALRQEIVDYIWPGAGLPQTLPESSVEWSVAETRSFSTELYGRLGAVDPSNASLIERLETPIDGLDSTGYLIHPRNAIFPQRLAVVQQGHTDWAVGNLDVVANDLLADGFTVLALSMPLVGWNTDRTADLPSGTVTWDGGSTGHRQMFPLPDPDVDGDNAFRFFLEPVVAGINHFVTQVGNPESILMTGLSGGGWTTTIAAAIDPRIDTSISVAGSYPMELRFAQADPGDDRADLGTAL